MTHNHTFILILNLNHQQWPVSNDDFSLNFNVVAQVKIASEKTDSVKIEKPVEV